MTAKYYIDESGNTGDLIVSTETIDFVGQDYFTLACINLKDSDKEKLSEFIIELKKKYKIQAPQLKFSKIKGLLGEKISFVFELLQFFEDENSFIIEIVDKKYAICANIVKCLILPPYFFETPNNVFQEILQWLYDKVTIEFLIRFTDISRNPSENGLTELFEKLLSLVNSFNDDFSEKISCLIQEAVEEYNRFKLFEESNTRKAFTFFLPIPDIGTKGQLIGILPHVSSYCNILARLNKLHNRELSKVFIIHDNQAHFEKIIRLYNDSIRSSADESLANFSHADFNFLEKSTLEFCDDKDQIGLQIADIFAGFINKSIPYLLKKEGLLDQEGDIILIKILLELYRRKSINFVIPPKQRDFLFSIFDNISLKYLQLFMETSNEGSFKEFSHFLKNTKEFPIQQHIIDDFLKELLINK